MAKNSQENQQEPVKASEEQNPASTVAGLRVDTRLSKELSESHRDREETDREVTQDRVLTDQDRLDEFRQSFFQSSLPDIPPIPGFHVCWLTTTNARDSIHNRIRLGYTPIKADEVPGWDSYAEKSGEYAGCISVNEMVAFKLPNKLYQMYMTHAHYDEPNNQEGMLRQAIDRYAESAKEVKGRIIEEEGTAELGKTRVRRPVFVN